MKILAVDDDPIFLDLLGVVLADAGYSDVTLAHDAEHALRLISKFDAAFECFLVDIMMPGINGFELCEHIRRIPHYVQTPILMLTAVVDEISVDRAFLAGATDYVTKPLNGLQLGSRIRSASILYNQTKKVLTLQKAVQQLEAINNRQREPQIEKSLEVDAGPNCLTIDQLQEMLISLPKGVYAISCFALRIIEFDALYPHLSTREVSAILTEVAGHISEELGARRYRFAYYGNGAFGCVVFGRAGRLNSEAGLNGFGIKQEIVAPRSVSDARTLNLRFSQKSTLPLLAGQQAAATLRDSLADVGDVTAMEPYGKDEMTVFVAAESSSVTADLYENLV